MGRLTKDKFGFSAPVAPGASLYTRHPYHYRDVRRLSVIYETDRDPVMDILPENLESLHDPPQVVVTVTEIGLHVPLGAYAECYVAIRVRFEDQPLRYVAYMWTNSDAAMAAGREIYGAPKKLAGITLDSSPPNTELMVGTVERPTGHRILTASALLTEYLDPKDIQGEPAVLLKVIPDACGGGPSVAELLRVDSSYEVVVDSDGRGVSYTGIGSICYEGRWSTDPVHLLPPRHILGAGYVKMNIFENQITRLHVYE